MECKYFLLVYGSSSCLNMKRIFTYKNVTRILHRNYSVEKSKNLTQVFSAIQPTGNAHLGNYLGALRKWVDLQNTEENPVIFAIADLHSITLPQDPKELQRNIFVMASTVLGCGIDTEKSIFFKQSDVKQHSELCWILGTLSTMSRLTILPQFKEKTSQFKSIPVGIFLYPVLQAADVMLYRTTHVPVGTDQSQQIFYAHDLIQLFNNRFGSSFPIPSLIIDSAGGKVKSLQDPIKKMSKSDKKRTSCINLLDEPDEILMKVKKAVTDFTSGVTYDPEKRPGVANLILIHSGLTGKTQEEIVKEFENLDTGKYKLVLADVIIEHLNPIRKKIKYYLNNEEYLISELQKGAIKAEEIAEKTMKEVKERVGFNLSKINLTQILSKQSLNC